MKDVIVKIISGAQPKEFNGASRFNDAELTEWHIISTDQPDHIGDVMVLSGMELPASGKNIVLLNHDRSESAGLPVGKALQHQTIDNGDHKELWQLTKYNQNMPDAYKGLGEAIYNSRKEGYFTDSSIQFLGKTFEPTKSEDQGKPQWQWSGTKYLSWLMVEAGPVLIGMNQYTGDMKAAPAIVKDLLSKLENPSWQKPGEGHRRSGVIKLIPNPTIKLKK